MMVLSEAFSSCLGFGSLPHLRTAGSARYAGIFALSTTLANLATIRCRSPNSRPPPEDCPFRTLNLELRFRVVRRCCHAPAVWSSAGRLSRPASRFAAGASGSPVAVVPVVPVLDSAARRRGRCGFRRRGRSSCRRRRGGRRRFAVRASGQARRERSDGRFRRGRRSASPMSSKLGRSVAAEEKPAAGRSGTRTST